MEPKEILKRLRRGCEGVVNSAGYCFEPKPQYRGKSDSIIEDYYYQAIWEIYQAIEQGATIEELKEAIEMYQGKKK